MPIPSRTLTAARAVVPQRDPAPSRHLYFSLLDEDQASESGPESCRYLTRQLRSAAHLESDLPTDIRALPAWIEDNAVQVGHRYRDYLSARRAGAARRFFSTRSHALYFLRSVAPTKLVDGAWLYGLVSRWDDPRVHSLIRIYLEELGEGQPDRNHVAIYRRLLAAHGCGEWQQGLSDEHYVQGAIQLALARNADRFLPELIGYNLGYEQLPLHLLITAYELKELGIDPYYFTLHLTIDNADTGHGKQALQGVLDAQPLVDDRMSFHRRLVNGYRLNELGAGANSVVESFDLEGEVIAILKDKSTIGKWVHSDYCRIDGHSVTEWLADPTQIPEFLRSLRVRGWIKRHQPPQNSPLWKLIQGRKANMYGVFSVYEQQLIHDWIAGDLAYANATDPAAWRADGIRGPAAQPNLGQPSTETRDVTRRHRRPRSEGVDDFNRDVHLLEQQLAEQTETDAIMNLLAVYMSPAKHHTAPGLMATRTFTRLFG